MEKQPWFDEVFRQIDPSVRVEWEAAEGAAVEPGQLLCRLDGAARSLLTGERTALNFLQTLSGTATEMQASAETMKTEIKLPGITFTRSLNGAAANARVENGTLTLRSDARRDNFRDPDGKLSNNTAPLLLTEVDNRQPFTLTARITSPRSL